MASQFREKGFKTLKLKVGKNLKGDIEVLQAIHAAHPDCAFILDANEGYTSTEAIQVLETLHGRNLPFVKTNQLCCYNFFYNVWFSKNSLFLQR